MKMGEQWTSAMWRTACALLSMLTFSPAMVTAVRADEGGDLALLPVPDPAVWSLAAAPQIIETPASPALLKGPMVNLSDLTPNGWSKPDLAETSGPFLPETGGLAPVEKNRYHSLGGRIGAAKWEALGLFAYITATQAYWTGDTTSFHFKDEGWFGKDTNNLGIDKLTHAFNGYLFAEFLGARIARKTGNRVAAALPAALLSTGLQLYGELWDAHKTDSGFSYQDVVFNTVGAAFSAVRHAVPGLEEKLDFRLMMVPNSQIYSFKGKRHYEQQRFLLSLELAGFDGMKNSPFRFLELQAGYRGKNFLNSDRAAGVAPKRDIFFGVAINVKELFFKDSRSRVGRMVASGLNYFQIPYVGIYGR